MRPAFLLLFLAFPADQPRTVRAASPIVNINSDWLAERGKGPYLLRLAGATYVLQTDVRTEGTAFVIDAPDVTLDLNGHKAVYGDSPPLAVRNGGFEEGTKRKVPGWDLADAPCAELAPNTSFLFGKQVLRLKGFRTAQRIVSEPAAVPLGRHEHAAVITPARGNYRTSLTLTVIDAETRRVLGQGKSGNVERGTSAVARFEPGTSKTVRLVVEAVPPAEETANLDLDAAEIVAAHDYGVVAANVSAKELPGWNHLAGAAGRLSRRVSNVTVKNGSIVQGQGRGLGSSPLFCQHVRGISLERLETLTTGMDTSTIDAVKASGGVTVRRCILRHEVENITCRFKLFSAIRLAGAGGPIVIEDNQILGVPQIGISLSGTGGPGQAVLIKNNRIHQRAVAANGYALLLAATQNFEIAGNRIVAENGRGILLDSYRREPIANGRIHDNYVEVRERPNREYWSRIETRALRLRNTVDRKGPHRDLLIRDNTFAVVTGDGLAQKAFAVLVSYQNADGSMNNANVRLEHNTLRAITTSRDPKSRASALVFDGMAAGVGLHLHDNILESNDSAVTLGEADGGAEEVRLTGNTIRRLTDGPPRTFHAVRAGHSNRVVRKAAVIGPRLENGAELDIGWIGSGRKDVSLGQLLRVSVRGRDTAVAGAEVTVRDREGIVVFAGKTDERGELRGIPVVTVRHEQCTADPRKIRTDQRGPFRVTAQIEGKAASRETALRDEGEIRLRLPHP